MEKIQEPSLFLSVLSQHSRCQATGLSHLRPSDKRWAEAYYPKEHLFLSEPAPKEILDKKIDWSLFPPNFLKYPVHLQHDNDTGMTEGAVHNYCNAVLWQYHGK